MPNQVDIGECGQAAVAEKSLFQVKKASLAKSGTEKPSKPEVGMIARLEGAANTLRAFEAAIVAKK